MASCTGTEQVQGTGRAATAVVAAYKAFGHMLLYGQQQCAGKSCDAGSCTFGLTSLEPISDADVVNVGIQVQVTVRGQGSCFCQ
jgi:hypothetical protein